MKILDSQLARNFLFYITNCKMDINKCAAINCKSKMVESPGKTFHRFPTWNPTILEKWISKSGLTSTWNLPFAALCSDHFEDSCFDKIGDAMYIKADAVPTLFFSDVQQNSVKSPDNPQIISVISLDNLFKSSNEGTDPLQVFHEKIDEICKEKKEQNRMRKKVILQLLLSFKRFAINQQKIKVVLNRQRLLRRKMMQTAMIMMLLTQQELKTNS